MKVDVTNRESWAHHRDDEEAEGTHHAGQQDTARNQPVRPVAKVSTRASRANDKENAATATLPAASRTTGASEPMRDVATEAVVAEDALEAVDQFNQAMQRVYADMSSGKDVTDDILALLKQVDNLMKLLSADRPTVDQQHKIDRLTYVLEHAQPGESVEESGKRAHLDLSRLSHHSSASDYAKYGKLPSTVTRAALFDWARFHNSNVLKNTSIGKLLQRPRLAMLDQLGPGTRTGSLVGTRANSAGSYITKGVLSLLSGLEKASKGQDPTKDFLSAFAAFGQGANELVLGVGTDIGNHLARSRALAKKPGPSAEKPTESKAPAGSEYRNFGKDDPLESELDQQAEAQNREIDEQVADGQQKLRDQALAKVDAAPRDVQQLTLQDTAHDIAPEYYQMQEIGAAVKKRSLELAKDTHENIVKIDEKAQQAMAQLKALGFDNVEAARASGNAAALALVGQIDQLAELKRSAYDVFNKALAESDSMLKQATEAFHELTELRKASPGEAAERLKAWGEKYGKRFAGVQDKWLKQTDTWPEWMKVSKPLRMQLIPTAVNTALGAIPFGIALDDYIKKAKNGTLTEQDKLNFASACINLIAGPVGFIPVIGPFASIVLTIIGAICGGMADQSDQRAAETAEYNLKEQLREQYNKAHPDSGIGEPYDGD
ncbi:hypothetical protein [Paraburkholderia azotifigens]|uniref:Type III effector protein n=1 Tax=Paraburkholderia azotifigens TaxID=2057004 RepID=A0ABU9R958_9BURK